MKLFLFAALLSFVQCSPTNPDSTPHGRDCSKKEEWMNQSKEFPSNLVAFSHERTNVECELASLMDIQTPHFGGDCGVLTESEKDKCFFYWEEDDMRYASDIIPGLKAMGDDDVNNVIDAKGLIFSDSLKVLYKPSRGPLACQAWSQLKKDGKFVLGGDFEPDITVVFKDGKCYFFPYPILREVAMPDLTSIATSRFCHDKCAQPIYQQCSKRMGEWGTQCMELPSDIVAIRDSKTTNIGCREFGCFMDFQRVHFSSYCWVVTKFEKDECFWKMPHFLEPDPVEIIPGLKAMGDDDVEAVINYKGLGKYFPTEHMKSLYKPSGGRWVCQAWSQLKKDGKWVIDSQDNYSQRTRSTFKDGKCLFFYQVNKLDYLEAANRTINLTLPRFCKIGCWDWPRETDANGGWIHETHFEVSSDSSIDVIQNTPTSASEDRVEFFQTL